MAVINPDERMTVAFLVDDERYETTLRRGQIIHEAFHTALPAKYTAGRRLTFQTPDGIELFADNFVGEVADKLGVSEYVTTSTPISGSSGPWQTYAFDHLAIAVADRADATSFFRDVVQMEVMREDAHLTVLSTGPTALFLFDAGTDEPLAPDRPSAWHHLGFVVDNLEHVVAHLRQHEDRLISDFTLLERDERWSLYVHYKNGDVRFMIQFSEIKPDWRGFADPERAAYAGELYDYSSRPYGLQFQDEQNEAK